jgi:capsular exopolysaccharide synthesis family protein
MGKQQSLLDQLNKDSIQFNILKREVDTNRELYQGLLQRLKETGVTKGLEFGNIHVLDSARPSFFSHKPQWIRDLSIALLLGLGLGVAAAFLLDYFDRTMKTPKDAEEMGLPALGVIPVITRVDAGANSLKPATHLLLASANSKNKKEIDRVPAGPVWLVQESYRRVCASIMLARGGSPAESILITSSLPREGKTTTVAHLGVALADVGARTVMIDADFRRSALSQEFGLKRDQGQLSLHLAGHLDFDPACIHDTKVPNLHMIPAGPRAPNPVALLNSKELGELLKLLRGTFQYILIDSPPLLSVADAKVLASMVDGVVLVVEANKTPREAVQRACGELQRSGAFLLGTLINRADLGGSEYSEYTNYYPRDNDFEYDSRFTSPRDSRRPMGYREEY